MNEKDLSELMKEEKWINFMEDFKELFGLLFGDFGKKKEEE